MSPRVQIALLAAALLFIAATSAQTQQTYGVSGDDSYRIGTALPTTTIAYAGTQRLVIAKQGPNRRYTAEANYTRMDQAGKASVRARFVQRLTKAGSFEDLTDGDPDFLTILNQPFAIQLDPTTMGDLRSMRRSVPFQAESPLGGSTLHGFLRPQPGGKINGRDAVGILFEANGPMTGPLPQHPEAAIAGTIRMSGTAYYALHGALLLALDATLTITGNLVNHADAVPVKIVYHRTIRAAPSNLSQTQP
ncbi:MAG TPA: hypothetical protein VGN11_04150 [Candidatus Baltobacteraceae bacterium]|jgi:hypothetical protein|nr:hypothetical protein [Candidatus Baltobacteraceae bacterium]